MANQAELRRAPASAQRPPAAAAAVSLPAAVPPGAARVLQQRLGNNGLQALLAPRAPGFEAAQRLGNQGPHPVIARLPPGRLTPSVIGQMASRGGIVRPGMIGLKDRTDIENKAISPRPDRKADLAPRRDDMVAPAARTMAAQKRADPGVALSPGRASPAATGSAQSGAAAAPIPSLAHGPGEKALANAADFQVGAFSAAGEAQDNRAGAAATRRITAAPDSALKAQATAQQQLINADCAASEAQVSRVSTMRQQQIGAHFSAARQGVSGFFTRSVLGVQTLVAAKQAQIAAVSAGVLQSIQGAVAGALLAIAARGEEIRGQIEGFVETSAAALQGRVQSIANQIAGAIGTIPLPDIPGIAQIRSIAASVLGEAVGIVNAALGQVLAFMRSALGAAMQMLVTILQASMQLASEAMSAAGAAIQHIMQLISQSLDRVVHLIASGLDGALNGAVLPLLDRLETTIVQRIADAERQAVGRLRANRDSHLEILAAAVAPEQTAGSRTAERASAEDGTAEIRVIGSNAARNGRTIVELFASRISAGVASLVQAVAAMAGQIIREIASRISQTVQRIATAVSQVQQSLTHLVQAVFDFIQSMLQVTVATVRSVVEYLRGLIQGPVDQIMQFAQQALSRITGFIGGLVASLISGAGSLFGSAGGVIGGFTLAAAGPLSAAGPSRGPITIPAPSLPVLVRIVFGAIITAVGSLMVLLFGAELAVIIMANPLLAIAILVVLLLLLLLLLYIIYKLIIEPLLPRRPPGKRVLRATPSKPELGVGGRDITGSATIAPGVPSSPPLTWTINPGGTVPAGLSVSGSGRRVTVHAAQPPHGTTVGGTTIVLRAALTANAADFADSAPILLVQVVSATYDAAPPLAAVPSAIPGTPPPNSAEPNRDGIAGNTALVNAITAPASRPIAAAFRRSLGASVAGTTITPGTRTGDIGLRITDTATGARLDETKPAAAGPAALMADLAVNAVPTRVSALTGAGRDPLGPYSTRNTITYAVSDALHPPLTRIVGELITDGGDDFNLPPPNNGFNNAFDLNLAVPANSWTDRLVTPAGIANATDGRPAIDVNRFVGPGVPQLPRAVIYRQRFQYSSWQGAGTVISNTLADGRHIRTLFGTPGAFQFKIEHRFGNVAITAAPENYVGNPLMVLSAVTATPTAPGATALAADGAATANLGVTSTVAGRSVTWSVLSGDMTIPAGNPAVPPATATLQAGFRVGNFAVRAADTISPNRRIDANVGLSAVALRNMRAALGSVPPGTSNTTVSLNAQPGGRTVNWRVDAAAAAAGVTVTPASTGPAAPPMSVTVTRPAAFTGVVTVTATDSVLAASTASVRIRFR
ncbi:MAG: hypothetical protein QOD09_3852 [Bradyrhizobium sp.]|jgi:hypothetical protein|nr:hypothetical protein [Bradyrhizobium sp.]